ncbi:DUF5107 domain-containing protein [Clostridium sp. KNHs214]|uniref:DUF5107 domain-containing protein n=1 Tax=Clostridium sp. KNHs214 TaxID=1540257 RepID=UPI000558350F|nr:DUF5107 domain-containing protein [Clostridium sp. KNHs214]
MIHIEKFMNTKGIYLEDDDLRVVVLPEIGGKIASLYHKKKEFELLFQNKFKSYEKAALNSAFEKFDASGFDDAFPTIDPCRVVYGNKEILYPDHGEVWSSSFDYKIENNRVFLSFNSTILPYKYMKTLYLEEGVLTIDYNIKNTGNLPIPCIWAMHCLINCEEEMKINFPKGTKEIINVHKSVNLGDLNSIHPYPKTTTPKGEIYNLNKVGRKNLNNTEKYYAYSILKEGICSVYYPNKDITYKINFNKDALPYLGFWVTEGGFRGDYNCALEPTNGFYDTIPIAKENNKLFYLKKEEDLNFKITIELF